MKKYKIATVLSLLVVLTTSSNVFAEAYYDILKREYKNADLAIEEADFDRPGYPLARLCIEIDEDRPMTETYVMISKYTRVTDGQGPLLPKTTITKIIYRPYNSDVFAGYLFDQITTEFNSHEVVAVQKDGLGKATWTLNIRKTGDNIIFRREFPFGEDKTKVSYGYCFHRENKQ